MVNSKMQSMFEDFKPVNEATIIVEVQFEPDQMVQDLAVALRNELIRVAGPVGEPLLDGIHVEDIRRYLCTLSYLRRARVVGAQNKSVNAYRSLVRTVAIPVLWYQVLLGIGKAFDRDYSIEFVPGTSIRESDLLAPEEMLTISNTMFNLQNNGFKVVAGIPKDPEGELDFMAMAHVGEMVLSYRKSHPVYGFLASFFATQEVSIALGALVRIRYGYDSDYRTLLTRVTASVGGE